MELHGIRPLRCLYHQVIRRDHDWSYYEKIAKNLLQPAASYLNESELLATMCGRYRGDARRLDMYVLPDPLNYEGVPQ